MKSTVRSRRLRNVHLHDEKHKEPFFSHSSGRDKSPFFNTQQGGGQHVVQTKLTVGKPGDQYEQEADRVASHVVAKSGQSPEVQRQDFDSVQRVTLTSPAEDEKLGTAEARMEKDKLIQEKIQKMDDREEEVQAKEEEEEVQAKEEEEEVQAKEEEEEVQAKEEEEEVKAKEEEEEVQAKEEEEEVQAKEEEEEVQAKEEEEEVQAKEEEEEVQAKEEEEEVQAKEEEEEVQTKEEEEEEVQAKGARGDATKSISEMIKKMTGKGRPLSGKIRAEMELAFETDFSGVNIHTDAEAIRLNKQLHSQAFTRGHDIFFNEGKYRPETSAGKLLLAHELTHVMQQCGRKKSGNIDKKQK